MMIRLILFILTIQLLSGCAPATDAGTDTGPGQQLEQYEWLLGTWNIPGESYYESWTRDSDSSFAGLAFGIKDQDTTVFEHIRIFREKGTLVYQPNIEREGGPVTVDFRQSSAASDTLIFENPENEFPQLIHYQRIGADSLYVFIQGTLEDQSTSRRYFSMKRYTGHGGTQAD